MSTRIALVTDTHTWHSQARPGPEVHLSLLEDSERLFAALLDDVRAAGPDLVLHLGDMTCGGGYFSLPPDDFSPQLRRLHQQWEALGLHLATIPGNHDCPPGELSDAPWGEFEALFGLIPGQGQTIDVEGVRLILVNAQGHDGEQLRAAWPDDPIYGWVGPAELARVEADLASAGNRPVLLFIHQLLFRWRGPHEWQEYYGVRNGGELLALFERFCNVRALFQGHAHLYEVTRHLLGGRTCTSVICPAIIEYPVGWLLLEVSEGGMQVSLRLPPCAAERERARHNGQGQEWRMGDANWVRFDVDWSS